MALSFALLALHLGRLHDLSHADGQRILRGLQRIPEQIREILDSTEAIAAVATTSRRRRARSTSDACGGFPVAREGAQKLKEISYIHAEAYQASELKHGPLA